MKHNLGLAENIASILLGFGKLSMKKSIHRGHTHSARYRKRQLGMALLMIMTTLCLPQGTFAAGQSFVIKDIFRGAGSSSPSDVVKLGSAVYFAASAPGQGIELWKSTGNSATPVADIFPGASDSNPDHLVVVNNTLFFTANDGVNGVELWKSNGTAVGTTLVKNIRAGLSSSNPGSLTAVGSTLYFTANDGSTGTELSSSTTRCTLPPIMARMVWIYGRAAAQMLARPWSKISTQGRPAPIRPG